MLPYYFPSGGLFVARKKRGSDSKENFDWRDKIHFVEFSLEEEIDIKEWYDSNSPVWVSCLEQLFDDEWAVKVSPPKGGDDWYVSGQFRGQGKNYDGHTFTVRYPDMEQAVILLFYVLTAMLEDGKMDQVLDSKARAWLG
jgi:hypothetical protein